jgi:hypothetical protein
VIDFDRVPGRLDAGITAADHDKAHRALPSVPASKPVSGYAPCAAIDPHVHRQFAQPSLIQSLLS